ncbi:MAG: hypothetical protein AAGE93_08770, partial [Bacteroidota bacterium]
FNSHYIRVGFEVSFYAIRQSINIPFITSAYAYSPCESGFRGSEEGLDTLYVITVEDYDTVHSAGDTLNDMITMEGQISYRSFEDDNYVGDISLQRYVSENRQIIEEYVTQIRLNQEPLHKQKSHSFKIAYHLGNGEQYVAQTNEVLFQ